MVVSLLSFTMRNGLFQEQAMDFSGTLAWCISDWILIHCTSKPPGAAWSTPVGEWILMGSMYRV